MVESMHRKRTSFLKILFFNLERLIVTRQTCLRINWIPKKKKSSFVLYDDLNV